jgi:hypothetical protein
MPSGAVKTDFHTPSVPVLLMALASEPFYVFSFKMLCVQKDYPCKRILTWIKSKIKHQVPLRVTSSLFFATFLFATK